ncbi:MAG: plasmid stabilization protein, partial [Haloechinothrix sp.]
MPQQAWNKKRERQYEHIKSGQLEYGASEDRATEVAARTVNKSRARTGESQRASKTSVRDVA